MSPVLSRVNTVKRMPFLLGPDRLLSGFPAPMPPRTLPHEADAKTSDTSLTPQKSQKNHA